MYHQPHHRECLQNCRHYPIQGALEPHSLSPHLLLLVHFWFVAQYHQIFRDLIHRPVSSIVQFVAFLPGSLKLTLINLSDKFCLQILVWHTLRLFFRAKLRSLDLDQHFHAIGQDWL